MLGSFFALFQSFSQTCPSGIPPCTKSPKYALQKWKNVRQTCKKPYNFPLRITLSQYFLALPYASCRVQQGVVAVRPLIAHPRGVLLLFHQPEIPVLQVIQHGEKVCHNAQQTPL